MKNSVMRVAVAAAVLMGALVSVPRAWAEGGTASSSALELSPSGTRLTLSPGDVLEGRADHCPQENDDGCAITVKNIGTGTVRYRVYTSPYAVKGENNELSFAEEASTTYTQLSRWIDIKNADGQYEKEAEFTVRPGETQTVAYRVTVPDDIPGGSQYAVIWAMILSDETSEGGGIETVGQVGAVLTGRSTEDIVETATVTDYDFTKFAFSGPLHAQATIENTGNVDFAGKYTYTAKTIFGKELYTSGEQVVAAYPETTYHVNFDWENTPFMGIFQVEWKVIAADVNMTESHIVIVMPVIVIIVLVLLLTVMIVWIIIISRKRKERKARKLA